MENNLGRDIGELTKKDIENIKMLSFDGDGVTKKIGTEFVKGVDGTELKSHKPSDEMMEILIELSKYFFININSGRSVEYLVDMYGVRPKFVYLGEIGMYVWVDGNKLSNFELSDYERETLRKIRERLGRIKDLRVKGFEPKGYLVTMHCESPVEGISKIVSKIDIDDQIYCWWTGEAYDIGVKRINKETGLGKLCEKLRIETNNVMTIGHGVNDKAMLNRTVGIDVSTDADGLTADFVTRGEDVGGLVVVKKILSLIKGE